MCAVSRMVVKRPGTPNDAGAPAGCASSWMRIPCDVVFEMGATLAKAASANGGMFADLAVKLCHRTASSSLGWELLRSLTAHTACGGGSIGGLTSAGRGHS